jgi:hemolysin activation/secretion protein
LKYRQPLVRKPDQEFALSFSASKYHSLGRFLDTPLPSRGTDDNGETNVTALRFGQEWIKRDAKQVIALQSQFSFGVNALGATVRDESPDGRFFSWRGRAQYVRSLAPETLFSLRGEVQFADRPLVPVEQFAIGGVDTVRGYRQNSLLMDSGWFASAEFQVPILRIPKWNTTVKLAPFFDIGGGWNQDGESSQPGTLMSTGVGLVFRIGQKASARLDWGIPLTSTEREGQSLRQSGIHFSIQYSP